MVNEPYTQFKAANSIGNTMLMDNLENNLKTFLDWCLLGIGAYVNVQIPTTGFYGGNFHTLMPVDYPGYTSGQVWSTVRKDLVWETGVSWTGTQPISISGVYINSVFYATNDATYGHYYNYPEGLVFFTGSVPLASSVAMNYSYRLVQVGVAGRGTNISEVQYDSLRPDSNQWTTYPPYSGDNNQFPDQRSQLPAIVIQSVPRGQNAPYQLGDHSMWVERDVVFEIIAETSTMRNKLVDILALDAGRQIWLYDTNSIVANNFWPLDYRGMLVSTTGMYPYLVDNYRWYRCFFKESYISEVESLNTNLHQGKVRMVCEMVVNDV